jgi:hypothetical protein
MSRFFLSQSSADVPQRHKREIRPTSDYPAAVAGLLQPIHVMVLFEAVSR